ncbi:MAG: SGNH/GDSL hydrolase family protein [Methyloceanibacter sp.]
MPASCARLAAFAAALFLSLLLAGLGPRPASAQSANDFQRSYINPFPSGDRYRVVVLGDSLGDGLWSGLYRTFEEDTNLEIVKRSKVSTGFVRTDYYDWNSALGDILKSETYQIAVVMFGANDDQAIREGKEWVKPGTDRWNELYGARVEAFIKKLRAANIAVYWVGLPVMRSPDQATDAEAMNEIFREKAFINGAKFIDTWSGFTDEAGRYSAYGPDMSGQVRRLRADDGIHFTMRGYLKLAHFVEKEIRRDLSLAKLERNIPLAGTEDEQAKVTGHLVAPAKAPNAPQAGPDQPQAAAAPEVGPNGEPVAPEMQQSTVGEVNVVRPVISDTTLQAAQSLTPQGAASSMPESEMIMSDLSDGLTALASISAVNDLSVTSSKPRLPLTQRPYYKVLIKGEQLKPKAGRADDFAWPNG